MLRPHIVDVSCGDSTDDIQWAIDVVTTDPQEGTLQHPPARYGIGVANQRGETAKETTYRAVLREHHTVRLRPLAIKTLGALGTDFQRFIRDAARLQARLLSLSLRMHSLSSSTPWRSASTSPSCARRHRFSTAA